MKIEHIAYEIGGTRYVGTLAVDEIRGGNRPGVLVAHEGPGLTDVARSFARRLAEAGYVAYAMDYHGDGRPVQMDVAMTRIRAHLADPAAIRMIAAAALDVLRAQPPTDPARLA